MESEIPSQNGIVAATNDIQSVEDTINKAEKYLEVMGRMRLLAIKLTNTLDWSVQGEAPYLEKSGCDKIASAFGVKLYNPTFDKETMTDDRGEYVLYTCSAHGAWNNVEENEIGTCSSRDDFFGKGAGGKLKPLSEVDLTDIKKKAFTNLCNRLIKKLLGLSFTWEEIEKLSEKKITKETCKKVVFGSGSKGGNTDSPETKKYRDECRAMLLRLNDGEENACIAMLEKMTAFQGKDGPVAGKKNILHLSEKQVQILHGKLKKGIEELDKGGTTEA